MFPTQVGMNRVNIHPITRRAYVPHAGGDEPVRVMICLN